MSTIHGNAHRCQCGALWYDSDGGPCHLDPDLSLVLPPIIEVQPEFACECGCLEFRHIAANPEEVEGWECCLCGSGWYTQDEIEKYAILKGGD